MSVPSVMVGITSYNRPRFLEKTLRGIRDHVAPIVDAVYIHNDGSDRKYQGEYGRAYKKLPQGILQDSPINQGVAVSKNALLKAMIAAGATAMFLCEDDIVPQSTKAVTGYLNAAGNGNFQHLSFAHHGPANAGGAVEADEIISYYPHSIGAWCLYSAESLKDVGLFDENFHQAWEHVELTLRLAQAGYTSGAYRYADATGSQAWLKEIPGLIEKSSIRPRGDWQSNIRDGLRYWRDNKPETYNLLFGEGCHLEHYAKSICA